MVYIINGHPNSGKSYFARKCVEMMGDENAKIFSTVDTTKQIAKSLGWNGTKTDKDRWFLSELKRLTKEWKDFPFQEAKKKIDDYNFQWKILGKDLRKTAVFIMSREPDEIARFENELGAKSIFLMSPNEDINFSNDSDANVANHDYDYIIANPMNDEIIQAIDEFLEKERLYYLPERKQKNKVYIQMLKGAKE